MDQVTEKNLKNAFAGESQAYVKYSLFAEAAEKEGNVQTARLFRAIAYAELVHAKNHLKVLGGIGKTADNLQQAIEGETYEVETMYPEYDRDAKTKGERDAERSIHYALEAEKIHAGMYQRAKHAVGGGQDIAMGDIFICPICGYTEEGNHADICPVCKAKRSVFKKF